MALSPSRYLAGEYLADRNPVPVHNSRSRCALLSTRDLSGPDRPANEIEAGTADPPSRGYGAASDDGVPRYGEKGRFFAFFVLLVANLLVR